MTPKVSVVIPVFKAAPYIEKCLRSLFSQTLQEVEYIFIDDCSPDESVEIIERIAEEYQERQSQIKIIRHERNKGVSQSRQDGINNSQGEFVIHCDPDDWVEAECYEVLYTKAKEENLDLVINDFYYHEGIKHLHVSQNPIELTTISVLQKITGVDKISIHGNLWSKLVRREFYKKIHFPQNINFCEDVYVMFQLCKFPLKIGYINRPLYHYRGDVPGSLVKQVDSISLKMDYKLIALLNNQLPSKAGISYDECIKSFIVSIIFHRAYKLGNIDNGTFKELYSSFLSYIPSNHCFPTIYLSLLKLGMKGKVQESRFLFKSYLKIRSQLGKIKHKIKS